ncbi:MAG TPA: S8 family serine peptidase [Jatrophihabitans sp.]|nr:S8 family serine peptidase [Jatrophihabitans sp.]
MIPYDGWERRPAPPGTTDAGRNNHGFAHRNQLVVDERDWPAVARVLHDLNAAYHGLDIRYGLARVELAATYDSVVYEQDLVRRVEAVLDGHRPRVGRNRLVTHAELEFDSADIEAAPKVVPSSAGESKPVTDADLPPLGGPDLATPIRVGVVDTPFVGHKYLAGSCLYRPEPARVVEEVQTPGHSTFVAGLILQLAPEAVVLADGAIKPDGIADLVAVHDAICALTLGGAHLINLSLGCVTADDEEPFVVAHAIEWATRTAQRHDRPVPLFVAACGNSGDDRPFWPAADPRVCSVAAATEIDGRWSVTDYSGRGSWVDVAARGEDLLSTRPNFATDPPDLDAYAYWSGTSFATAVVTGLKAAQLSRTGTADLADAAGAITFAVNGSGDDVTVPVYDPDGITHQ